jgi:hypothetical protein
MPCPNFFTPGKKETQNPLYGRLGGTQGQSGQAWKILLPPGFEPCTIQPIMSHYTKNAILGHLANMGIQNCTPKMYEKRMEYSPFQLIS